MGLFALHPRRIFAISPAATRAGVKFGLKHAAPQNRRLREMRFRRESGNSTGRERRVFAEGAFANSPIPQKLASPRRLRKNEQRRFRGIKATRIRSGI